MTEDMALSGAWATDTPSPPRRAKDKAEADERCSQNQTRISAGIPSGMTENEQVAASPQRMKFPSLVSDT